MTISLEFSLFFSQAMAAMAGLLGQWQYCAAEVAGQVECFDHGRAAEHVATYPGTRGSRSGGSRSEHPQFPRNRK